MGYTSQSAQDSLAKYGRHVEKGTDPSGGKWKSVETKKKLKEKYKGEDGFKSKQVTNRKTGERKTVTKAKGGKRVVVKDNPRMESTAYRLGKMSGEAYKPVMSALKKLKK
jgi:hypothetical protein